MNTFVEAVQEVQLETTTLNGGKTFDSSKDYLVDLFFAIGASRGKDLSVEFTRAWVQDQLLALRMLMWTRDVRGGAGEREVVRKILLSLEQNYPHAVERVLPYLSMYGRWDDLLIFKTERIKNQAFGLIDIALKAGNGLAAKWMPRKGDVAVELREFLKMSPKAYRKTLVGLTSVVEQQMCSGQWTDIKYSGVPSVAAARYQAAFKRHDEAGYTAYKAALVKGEAKVNAAAVYPYDIIKSYRHGGDATVVTAQWEALPNYIGDQLVLPMVDVSGSMSSPVGGNANLTCMDVSVSLGLYLADKNRGPFKDMFLTFSSKTKLERLTGSVVDKINQLQQADWGMSTNLEAAFATVLDYAVRGSVKQEDMPRYMVILSDMEFNAAVGRDGASLSAMEMIRAKYSAAHYVMPSVIFWNLNARSGNVPVKYDESGTALVSGFSPAIMASVLSGSKLDPRSVMLDTLNSERYSVIV